VDELPGGLAIPDAKDRRRVFRDLASLNAVLDRFNPPLGGPGPFVLATHPRTILETRTTPLKDPARSRRGPQSMPVALAVALLLVSGALLAPGLLVGPSLDAAVFNHIGGRLLDLVVPYVGAWDHKPPGIYILSAVAQASLGWLGPWTADWVLSLGATAGIGLAVAAVLRRLDVFGLPRAAAAVGAIIFASQFLLALGGGLTEAPAALFVALALVLAVGSATAFRLAGIGALICAALLVSVQLVPAGAAVLLLSLALRPGDRLRASIVMGVGLVIPLALVAGWLGVIGALPAGLDAVVRYSTAYRGSSGNYGAILAAPVAAWTVLASLFLVTPALLGTFSLARISPVQRAVATALALWIGLSLLVFVVQGRFYAHYAIPLAVPLGILAGLGLQRMAESWRRARGLGRRALIALPLAATLVVSLCAGIVSGAMQLTPIQDESARMDAVAARLHQLPSGTLLVWGNAPRLYDLADRTPATRYSYLYPLTTPGYTTDAMIHDVARELAADPPEVIVDAGSSAPGQPGFLPLLIDRPIATDGRDLDLLDPLRSFVMERYDLAATVAGWPIYLLRSPEEPAT
jgi:hypothetical protein